MRRTSSLEAAADLHIHLSPPVLSYRAAPPTISASAKCDVHTCPWWPYSNSKDFKTNTALILIILFCALLCALAFNAAIRYILRQHRHRTSNQDVQTAQQKPSSVSSAAEMEVVPTLIFSAGMKLAGTEAECTICLSEFVEGDAIRVLDRCNHGFHVQCIQKWLVSHSSCPTCRASCFPQFATPTSNDIRNCRLGNGAEG